MSSAAAAEVPSIKVNEVESNGGTPGDWTELVNTGTTPVDVSGWLVKDNDDTHIYTIAAGTVMAPGAFLAVDVETAYGLGGADSARLYLPDGLTLVDSHSWTAHAPITYGRCPDGTGAFAATVVATKGAANDCGTPSAFIKVNEIESNGGTPGDWTELVNIGPIPVDLSGWLVKDNDDTHIYTIAAGTVMAPGAFLALDVESAYGLGAADSVRLFLPDGLTLADSHSWTAHAPVTYGRCPNGTGAFASNATATKGAANNCGSTPAAVVKVNEVESNGGTPGDWVELVNTGATPVDVSGWLVKDNDDTHIFTIAPGSTIAPGAFLIADVETSYGLGAADSARLFLPDGLTLMDFHTWTAHAQATYGRCPDGTGPFAETTASTKGAANTCAGQVPASPWPGGAAVATADPAGTLGGNMSGLAYEPSGVLWAVKNGPGMLYRLEWDGATWAPATSNGWNNGKTLRYPTGIGDPDAEGVTLTGAGLTGGVFVSTERDNTNSGVSRPTVLRFDPAGTGSTLTATKEWNLTADLPPVAANSGLEAISWIPDSFLTARGFRDEHTGAAYNPSAYPGHGDGLFFVGLEGNGSVYAYALDQVGGGFTRIATIVSGFPGVMDLEFEPESKHFWVVCDDTCQGRTATLDIDDTGKFAVTHLYDRPGSMPNLNNEGFAITPQSECADGHKPVFWSDDSNTGGNALRSGTLDCTVLDLDADNDGVNDNVDVTFPPGTAQASNPGNQTFSDRLLGGTTSGKITNRNGRTLTISDANYPAGVLVEVGAGVLPARFQLADTFGTIELGSGSYKLTAAGKTSTITTVIGEPAVVTVTVNGTPITLTVEAGESVTYTETPGNGTVAGLTGIQQSGTVGLRANGLPATACADIVIQNVIVASSAGNAIAGTGGNDLIVGRHDNDHVTGNGGSDCVATQGGDDVIVTTGGDDWIDAGGGDNVVNAGGGADTIAAGNGDDSIDCGTGVDTARAGRGTNANVSDQCETFAS
ncbi:lamin tail domain-containing protein [Acrocarpospora corrugata]|uniref:lamin tail domain-containing protein n=1 Tax=Acrocarpospora corrugata TaxID=35763 RepID=UPI001C3F74D4|nr:lamin tail domain-containing protein [Acrocarpospora corrugata]